MRPLLAILAVVVTTSPLAAQDRARDEAAIRAHVAAIQDAINQRDGTAYAASFAQDADVIIGDGPAAQGRAAIQAVAERIWTGAGDRRAAITPTSIRFVRPDVAIVNTDARFTTGATTTEDRGTWTMVREDGAWRIAALRVQPAAGPQPTAYAAAPHADALSAAERERIAAAVRAVGDSVFARGSRRDPAMYSHYLPNASAYTNGSRLAWGDYVAAAPAMFASMQSARFRPLAYEIEVLGRDAALWHGEYSFEFVDAEGNATGGTGMQTWVFTRETDGWRIAHVHVSQRPAP